jgi:hypothetical protein
MHVLRKWNSDIDVAQAGSDLLSHQCNPLPLHSLSLDTNQAFQLSATSSNTALRPWRANKANDTYGFLWELDGSDAGPGKEF